MAVLELEPARCALKAQGERLPVAAGWRFGEAWRAVHLEQRHGQDKVN